MVNVYLALLRADGTEPESESGYERADLGLYDIVSKPDIFGGRQIVFPDVREPGYGMISAVALCDRKIDGNYLKVWRFSSEQNCHAGVVPVIYNGQLYRGMEVQAKVTMNSADLCG